MKTKAKHTKGKWLTNQATLNIKDPTFYKSDVMCGGIRVAQVAGIGEDCANANAKLIAAAPDLLEACKATLDQLLHIGEHYGHEVVDAEINLLQQVIEEAEERS